MTLCRVFDVRACRVVVLALVAAGATMVVPAAAETAAVAAIRTGDHDGFGRVVVDLPPGAHASARQNGAQIVVELTGATAPPAAAAPRNVVAITVEPASIVLALGPGATWRSSNTDASKLIIDVLDAAAAAPAATPAATPVSVPAAAAPAGVVEPAVAQAVPPTVTAATAAAATKPPSPANLAAGVPRRLLSGPPRRQAVHRDPVPQPSAGSAAPAAAATVASIAADPPPAPGAAAVAAAPDVPEAAPPPAVLPPAGPLSLSASVSDDSVSLPFASGTGAAAFLRGAEAVVVFDERRPIDLAALRGDPFFASARVQLLVAATVLRLELPPHVALRLRHGDDGWTVARVAEASAPALTPIHADITTGQMLFPAVGVGRAISVPDPLTGKALLVGTLTQAGQGVVMSRRTPEFQMLDTFLGVAVEPGSDGLALRTNGKGFVLEQAAGQSLALDPLDPVSVATVDASHFTRRWDLPSLPTEALRRRLQAATAEAAAAPSQARTASRLAAVQAELALGLGAEASGLATLTRNDDARAAESPDAAALDSMASLLTGRAADTSALDDPRLGNSDEVALWRALRQASQTEGAPQAAAVFAATMPLLLAYPPTLRQRLLPLAAETMAQGGESAAVHRLLDARKDDASLDYARALAEEADGHTDAALAVLDRLAQSPDRRLHARAAVRAVELRLTTGKLTRTAAADALDRLIYAWRGDGTELALRMRVATLRTQTGNWRAALSLLRETADGELVKGNTGSRDQIRASMQDAFAQALAQDARAALPPLELVSIIEENPDLLPADEAGRALAVRLATRLASLELPGRAAPVLDKLMQGTAAGPARAEIGARLADLRLQQDDAIGALTALSASAAPGLPADLETRRTITFARATVARGGLTAALAALDALDTPAAAEARAGLLEQAKDWPAATTALQSVVAQSVPADGPLDEAQAGRLLRLATAAAQSGDEALLAKLREHDGPRFPPGKLADMFALLTQQPVQNVADLPRAAQEAALAKRFSAAMSSVPSHAPAP